MELKVIAGTISTSIFMLSQIPMLAKAFKTRSMHSYSYIQMLMNTGANAIHWCYISALPFGPIWFLHGFSTLSTAIMLVWYILYEKRSSFDQSTLNGHFFDSQGFFVKTDTGQTAEQESEKDISEFHSQFRPYVNAIYRGALVLTASPSNAEKLQVKIYLKAFMQYQVEGPKDSFKDWLLEIVNESFSELRVWQVRPDRATILKQERAIEIIAGNQNNK
jgi:hypothetical protein